MTNRNGEEFRPSLEKKGVVQFEAEVVLDWKDRLNDTLHWLNKEDEVGTITLREKALLPFVGMRVIVTVREKE